MNKLKNLTLLLLCALLITACHQAVKPTATKQQNQAPQTWQLNPQFSRISIITTKNNSVAEVSEFNTFSGTISTLGELSMQLDLASLETHIPIRNERIQQHLFQTDIHKTANIRAKLTPEQLTAGVHVVSFDVDLHGVSAIMQAEFMVFQQQDKLLVTLHKPLVVNAQTFGLVDGIDTLKNIAKLNSIDYTVPMTIILSWQVQE